MLTSGSSIRVKAVSPGLCKECHKPQEAQHTFRNLIHVKGLREVSIPPTHGQCSGGHRSEMQTLESRKRSAKRIFDCFKTVPVRLTQIKQARNQVFSVLTWQRGGPHGLGKTHRERGSKFST
jgi:hypothetical protein